MSLSLRAKLIGGFLCVVALTVVGGVVSYWGVGRMNSAATEANQRLADANVAGQTAFYAIKQYQNQADLIINRDLDIVEDFNANAEKMDFYRDKLDGIVDTAEEKAWIAELREADAAFDAVFHDGVVPEVKHQLEELIRKYDAESDELIGAAEQAAQGIAESIREELDEALARSDDQELKVRIEQLLAVRNMMFWMIKQYQNQADLIINQNEECIEDFKNSVAKMDEFKEKVDAAVDTDRERALLAEIDKADAAYDELFFKKIVPEVRRIMENRIAKLDGDSDRHLAIVDNRVQKIVTSLKEEADEAVARFDSDRAMVQKAVVGFSIASCVIGIALGLLIAGNISRPINRVIAGLTEGADQVTDAAGQVSSASQSLAEGASEQASSLEETSSALEQMAAMTRTNAENARQANELSDQAKTAAQRGDETMEQLNEAMVAICDSSGQISKIIKVIEEIAFQTNLLALNAAVEAARAGEHGKGFAVVADEVRNLAQRAAQAAQETTGLIEDSVNKAGQGKQVAAEVGTALGAIVGDVTNVSSLVNGITKASEEQAQGVDQVNTAVSQMDKVTQQNASGAEESASASEELAAQASAVKGLVEELALVVSGNRAANTATSASTRTTAHSKQVRKRLDVHGGHSRYSAEPQSENAPAMSPQGDKGGSSNEFMALDQKNLSDF